MKILPFAILAAAAAIASSANADTMYKCTDPSGKVSFSDQPCTGKSKAATLNVIAPQRKADEQAGEGLSLERKETELERLRRLDAAFQERLRNRELAEQAAEERDRFNRMNERLAERNKPKPPPPPPPDPKISTRDGSR